MNRNMKSLVVIVVVALLQNYLSNAPTTALSTCSTTSRRCAIIRTNIDRHALLYKKSANKVRYYASQKDENDQSDSDCYDSESTCLPSIRNGRRNVLLKYVGALILTNSLLLSTPNYSKEERFVNAITMEYPNELIAPTNVNDLRNADNRRLRKLNDIQRQEQQQQQSISLFSTNSILSSTLWGIALWLLSGSRSNPITTPLANLLYNQDDEVWLQDRNDGLFSNLPWEYYIILSIVFVLFGCGANSIVNVLSDGNDPTISIQLACVSLIGGASLELGRISSGGKKQTRSESDRSNQLLNEFNEFAINRLQVVPGSKGKNCHRTEVVQAFRRYYSKYRQSDNVDYPLSDLEIEQLLRNYCRAIGIEMSPAGFYNGIQINANADVFVTK